MKVIYNNFDLAQIGEVSITQRRDYEGDDAPQRAKVVLKVKVDLFERTFSENFALIEDAQRALSTPNAMLQWTNTDTNEDYIKQTATLSDSDVPDEWAQYHNQINLTFFFYEKLATDDQNLPLLFTPAGGAVLKFDNVMRWQDGAMTERFDPRRRQRNLTRAKVTVSGLILGDVTLPLQTRRATLAGVMVKYRTAMNSADGLLQFGEGNQQMFSNTVRIEEFSADIDQAICAIRFQFTATYTLFPDDAKYAVAEATAEEKDDMTGELRLTISGRIQASDEATARVKMTTIVTAMLAQYGYTAAQELEFNTTPNLISGETDGDTFTQLLFTAVWRKWKTTNQEATFRAPGNSDSVPFGNVHAWEDGIRSERFDPLRPHRRLTLSTVSASGTWAAEPGRSLTDRRKQLLAMQRRMKTEVTEKDGLLTYGDFKQTVRIEEFKASINQAETGIDWSFSCNYVLFPENPYTTAEVTAEEKDNYTGEKLLMLNGKIHATDEATARTKMAALIAAFLKQYDYLAGQQLELNAAPNLISADTDGETFTELSFNGQWRKWKTSNQTATFKRTGGTTEIPFGNVRTWDRSYRAERFDQHRSERRHATGAVSGSGTWSTDPTQPVATRRTKLLAQQRAMMTEVNSADGVLKYGDETLTVRVEEFTAHVNQAETGIEWSFSASYSLFPNEGGYATCEFSAETRDDIEAGDRFLMFTGAIEAPNGALARAKLDKLRATTLAIYGFVGNQKTRGGTQSQVIDANADATAGVPEGIEKKGDAAGSSFIRLTWNEEYRCRIPGTIISSQYQVSTRDDTASNIVMTTYSGTITATGATADGALAAAVARALVLGANKEATIDPSAFLKSQSITIDRRQTTQDTVEEFLRVSFTYEYQSKLASGRSYLEVNTQTSSDTYGPDTESVSGFVVARDFDTANTIYLAQVRTAYNARLIRNESLTQNKVLAEKGSAYVTNEVRLDFTFTCHKAKPPGRVVARYAINVTRDWRTLTKRSELTGDVFAATRQAADGFLNTLLAGFSFGSNMASVRNEDRDVTPEADVLMRLHFEESFEDRLTTLTGVIEMEITESVTYSGTRWAVQALPFNSNGGGGISIPQPAGIQEGSRTVRGTVTCAVRATAEAWARRQRSFLTGDNDRGFYPVPEQMECGFEFVPIVDGIPTGQSANVRIHKVAFTFGEILPNYPAPT